jgi:GNAT superfamily N-acetyltransferase
VNDTLTLADVTRDPSLLTAALHTGDGTPFTGRALLADDAPALGRYFDGLSQAVRDTYAPHPLNAEHASQMCGELNYENLLPFLALIDAPLPQDVAAYFLLHIGLHDGDRRRYIDHGHPLIDEQCCTLAPCVADAWLSRGLGSGLFPHVAASVRRLGHKRIVLWGGVREDNPRAQHFYRKFGFRHVGGFAAGGVSNLDMVLDL